MRKCGLCEICESSTTCNSLFQSWYRGCTKIHTGNSDAKLCCKTCISAKMGNIAATPACTNGLCLQRSADGLQDYARVVFQNTACKMQYGLPRPQAECLKIWQSCSEEERHKRRAWLQKATQVLCLHILFALGCLMLNGSACAQATFMYCARCIITSMIEHDNNGWHACRHLT